MREQYVDNQATTVEDATTGRLGCCAYRCVVRQRLASAAVRLRYRSAVSRACLLPALCALVVSCASTPPAHVDATPNEPTPAAFESIHELAHGDLDGRTWILGSLSVSHGYCVGTRNPDTTTNAGYGSSTCFAELPQPNTILFVWVAVIAADPQHTTAILDIAVTSPTVPRIEFRSADGTTDITTIYADSPDRYRLFWRVRTTGNLDPTNPPTARTIT